MSVVVGINAFGQNPSACLVLNGQLVSFSHEERFNRLKGSYGLFPSLALNWCLQSNKLNLDEVDYIAINWDCQKYPKTIVKNLISFKAKEFFSNEKTKVSNSSRHNFMTIYDCLYGYSPEHFRKKIYDGIKEAGIKGTIKEIVFVDHHLSHAYQSYYQSNFNDSLVLVADGHGEDNCVSGYKVQNNQFSKILNYKIPYSLGWYYCGFTSYLGFKGNRDEGKFMGLAAFGESRADKNPWLSRLEKIIKITKDGYELNPYYFKMGNTDYHPRFTNALVDFIVSYNPKLIPISLNEKCEINGSLQNKYLLEEYVDLAYAVQTKLEEAVVSLVKKMIVETQTKKLCLSGGIFMNCKVNHAIYKHAGVEDIFIHPASSDDGSPIGSALYLSSQLGFNVRNALRTVQYGATFNNQEILNTIKACGITYKSCDDIASDVAQLLHQEKFIGWFQGGAEMGARALGGRSIISSPIKDNIKERLNNQVKYREAWRPYCPSMLCEFKDNYLDKSPESPFMIMASEATGLMSKVAPATVHIDNTVRPQTVKQEDLPLWYQLIENYYKLSGHPIILNTSFNVRSEPIVNSPIDAIRTFYSTGLNALAIGDYLITK